METIGSDNIRERSQKSKSVACLYHLYFLLFWLRWVSAAAHRFSLVAASGSYSLVAVCRLLTVVAFLVAEHVLLGTWASVVVVYGLSCPAARGIFPDQVLNLCYLHWQVDFFTMGSSGESCIVVWIC